MNVPVDSDRDDQMDDEQFIEWIVRYQDGALDPEELEQLADAIRHDPDKRRLFQRVQMRTADLHDLLRVDVFRRSGAMNEEQEELAIPAARCQPSRTDRKRSAVSSRAVWGGAVAVALLIVVVLLVARNGERSEEEIAADDRATDAGWRVTLAEEVRAKFFGSSEMSAGASVEPRRDYMLQSGLVKLAFPSGATAIVEAPAVFQVASANRLLLSSGSCSVHAPPGAEGFEVLTPVAKVVDRGTRFFVNVQNNNDTEIHVVEGATDLYSTPDPSTELGEGDSQDVHVGEGEEKPVRLTNGEAVRIGGFVSHFGEKTEFSPEAYRSRMPDRLVEYQATSTAKGGAEDLVSLTVQRDGRFYRYGADELIPITVDWFRGDSVTEVNGHMASDRPSPSRPSDLMEDLRLSTGIINFGGRPQPLRKVSPGDLSADADSGGVPGLGVRFSRPVVNHPGPDVVLFEVQSFSNPQDGDPFHVYAVTDREDLKPLTVTRFDLPVDSPGVREVKPLWSHRFPTPIESLTELGATEAPVKTNVSHQHFRVIGVGIDLSDLGFAHQESVDALFFQHAAEGEASKVDPVFIAGLPPLGPTESSNSRE
ncbi:FecR protein [Planctomycetes bacterium Pan216]|uniref:FecR protein n=1 Tax=Kolteria novifilia TaxID=2527975 RepID=A0A518AXA6_9BACT|nr:FecR protein [Planctomycetes bacterium Pan216]